MTFQVTKYNAPYECAKGELKYRVSQKCIPRGGGFQLVYEWTCPSDIFGLNPFSESDIFESEKFSRSPDISGS